MAKARFSFLDGEEADLIHRRSLACLSEIGIVVKSRSVLELLDSYGAAVDFDGMIARIPPSVVDKALESAPSEVILFSRNGSRDLPLPVRNVPFAATNGLAVFIQDFVTGEIRSSVKADLAEFTRLADALESVDFVWTALTAGDVPNFAHGPHEIWTALLNTTKHVQGITVQSARDAEVQIELASLFSGGREALRKRPIISVIAAPLSPLTFEGGAVEAQVEFAKAGVPIVSMSMSLGGMSSPVTVAGMVVNLNAENLASLVITQAASAGAPHVYSSESMPVDMRSVCVNYSSSEYMCVSTGAAQMARRYDLPCMVSSFGATGEITGIEGSVCELLSTLATTLSGTDLTAGMGSILGAKGCSFEQLVIDAYLWDSFRAFGRRFEISEETIAFDVMKQVGHHSTYLIHDHTIENFKEALHFWDEENLKMQKTLSDEMVPKAHILAEETLSRHKTASTEKGLIDEGERILLSYEKELEKYGNKGR